MKTLLKRKKILAISALTAFTFAFTGVRLAQSATAIEYGLIIALISIFTNIDVPVDIKSERDSDGATRLVFNADLANSVHRISVQASSDGSVQLRDSTGTPIGEVSVKEGVVSCNTGRIE